MRLFLIRRKWNFFFIRRMSLIRASAVVFLLVILPLALFSYMETMIMPSLEEISEYRTNQLINNCIDIAVCNMNKTLKGIKFVTINRDKNGKIVSIETNVAAVNLYSTNLSKDIQGIIKNISKEKIAVPVGSFTGNSLFAALGKKIYVKIIPKVKAKVIPDSVFTGAGFNQTKHQLFMDVEIEAKILFPLLKKNTCIRRRIMISETIIVGEVPALTLNQTLPFQTGNN